MRNGLIIDEKDNVVVAIEPVSKGDRVTITVTPDKGYELDKLTVKDASGKVSAK